MIIALRKKTSEFNCEVPGCDYGTFQLPSGETYVEVHHILPLSEGGEDSLKNAACVCANHHREAHYGSKHLEITAALLKLRRENSDF
ncbi:MAG: HNH endonuclease [Alphaproteobacteria bacterium]|nr:HNH endonuclease [Alphaproteobacteria bacterium]